MPTYHIADLIIQMTPKHQPLIDQADQYRIKNPVDAHHDCVIPDDPSAILKYHQKHPELTIGEAEYMMFGTFFYHELLMHQGMMFHASAVALDNQAYLFSGPSGIGKSTHADFWVNTFAHAFIINDDKPAIRIINEEIHVYGTPFSGKTNINQNTRIPLKAIIFIEQSDHMWMRHLSDDAVIKKMMMNTILPYDEQALEHLIKHIKTIRQKVNIYEMGCINDVAAATYAYDYMKEINP